MSSEALKALGTVSSRVEEFERNSQVRKGFGPGPQKSIVHVEDPREDLRRTYGFV